MKLSKEAKDWITKVFGDEGDYLSACQYGQIQGAEHMAHEILSNPEKYGFMNQINTYAWGNCLRKLNEANSRIVEFEDLKKGHIIRLKKTEEDLEKTLKMLNRIVDPIEGANWTGDEIRDLLKELK